MLREGALEFLAAFHSKDHESILRLGAQPEHVYAALGLIGLEPGHPPQVRENGSCCDGPRGDLVDIFVQWEADGYIQTADSSAWLREAAYRRPVRAQAWIFGGSRVRPDGTLSCRATGEAIALVDFPDSLISHARRASSRWGELWCEANTDAIPLLGTRVTIVLRPAAPRRHVMRLDPAGRLLVDGSFAEPAEVASFILQARELTPGFGQVIAVDRALRSDVRRVRGEIQAAGVPADALRFEDARPEAPSVDTATSQPSPRF